MIGCLWKASRKLSTGNAGGPESWSRRLRGTFEDRFTEPVRDGLVGFWNNFLLVSRALRILDVREKGSYQVVEARSLKRGAFFLSIVRFLFVLFFVLVF